MRKTIEDKYSIRGFFGKYRPLSNFDTTPFVVNGVNFKSAEHAFHYHKTLDEDWKRTILNAATPSDAKKLGRKCPMRKDWDQYKVFILANCLIEKFTQNENLTNLLLSTEFKYLEETNDWGDTYWGVCNGVGENNLGKILMFIRNQLMTFGDL